MTEDETMFEDEAMLEEKTILERERAELASVAEGLKFLRLLLCTDLEKIKYGIPEALKIIEKSLTSVEFCLNLEYLEIIRLCIMPQNDKSNLSSRK